MIDNDFYNREAESWWKDKDSPLGIIRYTMNPIRLAYVVKHLAVISYDYRRKRVLDIGCGGGFLTEEIAKFGLETDGLDPSVPTLHTARNHAKAMNLLIDYHEGFGEELPYNDGYFDMVFCLDVLEHVKDYPKIIREVQRVLKPGGMFFFETVNRTLLSYLVVIFFFQKFPLTRIMPKNVHIWKYFIKPKELKKTIHDTAMTVSDMQGILPGYNFAYNLLMVKRLVKREITFHELCALFRCHESFYKGLCYVGYAVKS